MRQLFLQQVNFFYKLSAYHNVFVSLFVCNIGKGIFRLPANNKIKSQIIKMLYFDYILSKLKKMIHTFYRLLRNSTNAQSAGGFHNV